ncbi:MAG: sugar phosphate isomerase/epimerase [Oscillospiraceae bacterium]|nr:sugar phosphate isomerase/epimerase [Oscillospiraceae bacterium]
MNVGVSTANLYPMRTEDALNRLLVAGFKTIEVFLNTESEANPDFALQLRRCADACGARIAALHSYNAISESFMYFTDYERRLKDGLKHLDNMFQAAHAAGAPYVIMHGDRPAGPLSDEDSIRRFERLYEMGQQQGITLLLENVYNYRSANLEYISAMYKKMGDKAGFVFDLKQCGRCRLSPAKVISAMSSGIRHVHLSDNTEQSDCLVPGRGNTDYAELIKNLKQVGFDGDLIIELYRANFETISDLIDGYNYLKNYV